MKHIVLISLCCIPLLMQAQSGFVVAGGDAAATGGSVSFSAGQAFFQTQAYGNGSLDGGMQQPIEIIITTVTEGVEGITPVISIYPVPVVDLLFLEVAQSDTQHLSYQLFDIKGRLLKQGPIRDVQTSIPMSGLDPALYFIRITHRSRTIHTFSILKTNQP